MPKNKRERLALKCRVNLEVFRQAIFINKKSKSEDEKW